MKSNKTYDSIISELRYKGLIAITIINMFLGNLKLLAAEDKKNITNLLTKIKAVQIEYAYNLDSLSEQKKKEYEELIAGGTTKLIQELEVLIKKHIAQKEFVKARDLLKETVNSCNKLKIDVSDLSYLSRIIQEGIRQETENIKENKNYKGNVNDIACILINSGSNEKIIRTINKKKYLIVKGTGRSDNIATGRAEFNLRSGIKDLKDKNLEPSSNSVKLKLDPETSPKTIIVLELKEAK